MTMKNKILIALFVILSGYALYLTYQVVSTDVSGARYGSFFIYGGSTNGWSYRVYSQPYLLVSNGREADWIICSVLDDTLADYLRSVAGWSGKAPFKVISEAGTKWYKAFIESNGRLIYVRGFPDYSGSIPSEDEKRICRR
jgi:hypothetical protein